MGYNTGPLMLGAVSRVTWLSDNQVRYRIMTENGNEFLLIDALRGTRESTTEDQPRVDARSVLSPDGKRAAFIRDYNLWVRDIGTGKAIQLTKDGVKDFGYATDNAGWTKSDRPVLLWSPDSKKIATFQHDARGVREMYLVHTAIGHPDLEAWKYPLPGDPNIFKIQRVIIDVDAARVIRLQMPPDPIAHRSAIMSLAAAPLPMCSGVPTPRSWFSSRHRVTTKMRSFALRMQQRARFATSFKKQPEHTTKAAMIVRTGDTFRLQMKSFGFPSERTGDTCTCTMREPAP